MIDTGAPRGVLLMTYGSPSSLDDVERYLTAVRGGRRLDDELLTEFRRRYEVIGGSPLIERTVEQARALERRLGRGWLVRAAMRFSEPSIETALAELAAAGVRQAVGIILSPQFSPLLMGGYPRAVAAAREALGPTAPGVTVAGAWFDEPALVAALGARIRDGLARLDPSGDAPIPVLLTAHSLPQQPTQTLRCIVHRDRLWVKTWLPVTLCVHAVPAPLQKMCRWKCMDIRINSAIRRYVTQRQIGIDRYQVEPRCEQA